MTTKSEEIGWLAGILDGEGAIVLVQNSTVRKSDGRKSISARVLMAVTEFELLQKYTEILSRLGIEFTYTRQNGWGENNHPKVNVNVHKQESVTKLLELTLPHLSSKQKRAELVLEYVRWRMENTEKLSYRQGNIDRTLQDVEYQYWDRYRKIFAGRGKQKKNLRDLNEAILIKNTPIYFPD